MDETTKDDFITYDKNESDDEEIWAESIIEEEEKLVSVKRSPGNETRYRRQKYCKRWEARFPWLREVPDTSGDANSTGSSGQCINCKSRLTCKKSHLIRHENSFKHQRLSGGVNSMIRTHSPSSNTNSIHDKTDDEILNDLCDFAEVIGEEQEPLEEYEISQGKLQNTRRTVYVESQGIKSKPLKRLDRAKLLKRINHERSILNEYYYTHQLHTSAASSAAHIIKTSDSASKDTVRKDSFDLFFESVSASVKTLPPKLAAELKSRVSQILTDFEIRAICEREAFLNSATNEAVGEVERSLEK